MLDDWRAQGGAPIVTAAVRLDGSLLWSGISIASDVAGSQRYSPASRYCIYSITKTLTGICGLKLEAAGYFRLTDPVRRWFPELPLPDTLQLIHLLQHSGGIRDYGPLPEYHEAVRTTPSVPWSDERFLAATVHRGLLFEPGSSWAYSNAGYLLVRRILERVSGQSFRHCVEELIARPLGLSNTFVAETIADWSSCVPGYGRDVTLDGSMIDVRATYHPDWCAPGVAVSNVEEVTRIYDSLFSGDLMDAQQLERMLTLVPLPQSDPPAVSHFSGLGIYYDLDGPFSPNYGHGGGGPGYSLQTDILPRFPAGRLAAAVFCNSSEAALAPTGEHELLMTATRLLS